MADEQVTTNGHAPPQPDSPYRAKELTANDKMLAEMREMVENVQFFSRTWFNSMVDRRRNLYEECGYPSDPLIYGPGALTADLYRALYDREPVATRVVELMPMECWQVQPLVYEDEDADVITPFEEAWDLLGQQLRPEVSWFQDEAGSPIWEYLKRVDILSGIGGFGVLLLGIDDGKNFQEPIDDVMTIVTNRKGNKVRLRDSPIHKDEEAALNTLLAGDGQREIPNPFADSKETITVNVKQLNDHERNVLACWIKERELTENSNPEGHNQYTGGGHNVILPKNRKWLTIDQVVEAMRQMGHSKEDVIGPMAKFTPAEVRDMVYKGFDDQTNPLTKFPRTPAENAAKDVDPDVNEPNGYQNSPAADTLGTRSAPRTQGFKTDTKNPSVGPMRTADGRGLPGSDGPFGTDLQYDNGESIGMPAPQAFANGGAASGDQYGTRGTRANKPNDEFEDEMPDTANASQLASAMGPQGGAGAGIGYSLSGTDQQYFGVIMGPSEQPAPPDDSQPQKPPVRLVLLRAFSEDLVQIVRYEWNIRNPRFGLPVMYRITLNDPRETHSGVGLPLATIFVHWSRVIHIADNLRTSEIYGVPRQRPVLNPLLDIQKIRGASAEGYWQSCFSTLAFETHPQLGGDVVVDKEEINEAARKVREELKRSLIGIGGSWKTLPPQVVDPTPFIDVQKKAICNQLGCPIRVFDGSERGELASSTDDENWDQRKRERQLSYLTPRVVVPFIDRLIQVGVLPEPGQQSKSAAQTNVDNLRKTFGRRWFVANVKKVQGGWMVRNNFAKPKRKWDATLNRWVTLESGQHVDIGGDGSVNPSGPKAGGGSKQGNVVKRPKQEKPQGNKQSSGRDDLPTKVLKEHQDKWEAGLSKDQKQAIEDYTVSGRGGGEGQVDQGLNQSLRFYKNADNLDAHQKKTFDNLQSAFCPLTPEPVTTYRGIQVPPDKAAKMLSDMKNMKKSGESFPFHGIVSSSLDEKAATAYGGGSVVFQIKAKTGGYVEPTHLDAAKRDKVTDAVAQNKEFLQKHGTQYKVIDIGKPDKSGTTRVRLEEVDPSSTHNSLTWNMDDDPTADLPWDDHVGQSVTTRQPLDQFQDTQQGNTPNDPSQRKPANLGTGGDPWQTVDAGGNERTDSPSSLQGTTKQVQASFTFIPEGGFSVEWPQGDAMSAADKAGIAVQYTQAMSAYVQGGCEQVMPFKEYLVHVWKWDEELAEAVIGATQDAHENDDTLSVPPNIAGQPKEAAEGTQAAADTKAQADQAKQMADAKAKQPMMAGGPPGKGGAAGSGQMPPIGQKQPPNKGDMKIQAQAKSQAALTDET